MVVLLSRLSVVILTLLIATSSAWSVGPPAPPSVAVVAVLKQHCSGCHGQQARPKGGLGHITDLHHLLENGQVIPGKPERSPLWQRISAGEMPPKNSKTGFARGDADLVRHWISGGAIVPASEVKAVAEADLLPAIQADIDALDARERRFMRYLSLANFARQPASERQMLRHGLTKLLNSLSWHARLSVPHLLANGLVYRVDLRHYRWTARQWDRLTADYPYAPREPDTAFRQVAKRTASERPVVRADWFVAVASRPPAYHDLLGLPSTDRALERLVQVDSATSLEEGTALRAGFNGSGVARSNRVIERQDALHGAYWHSYDFTDNTSRQNIFAYPLGPNPGPAGFRHAGGEIIFHLPNGLQGYLLVDGDGKRVDRAPGAIVTDPRRPDRLVENGLSCMGCHSGGIIPKDDQIRPHVLGNPKAFTAEIKADVLALYAPTARMKKRIAEDNERFATALRKLGIPGGEPEPISALVLRQEQTVSLTRAAEELGVEVDRLIDALRRDGERGRILGPLRLRGTVQREVFEEAFAGLLALVAPKKAIAKVDATARGSFRGHQSAVRAVAWAADGKHFASAAADGEIRLWDLATGRSQLLGKHSDEANAVAFSADGKRLLSGGADRIVRLWDVASGRLLAQLIGHTAGVRAVAFGGNNDEAISAGEDRSIRLWNLRTRSQTRTLNGHRGTVLALAVAPDGKSLLSGASDRSALLWRLADGRQLRRFDSAHEVSAVAFSGDGRRVVIGTNCAVVVYQADNGERVGRMADLSGTVVSVGIVENGKEVVSVARGATDTTTVARHRLADGKRLRATGPGLIDCAAFAADGRILVAVDRVIHLVPHP